MTPEAIGGIDGADKLSSQELKSIQKLSKLDNTSLKEQIGEENLAGLKENLNNEKTSYEARSTNEKSKKWVSAMIDKIVANIDSGEVVIPKIDIQEEIIPDDVPDIETMDSVIDTNTEPNTILDDIEEGVDDVYDVLAELPDDILDVIEQGSKNVQDILEDLLDKSEIEDSEIPQMPTFEPPVMNEDGIPPELQGPDIDIPTFEPPVIKGEKTEKLPVDVSENEGTNTDNYTGSIAEPELGTIDSSEKLNELGVENIKQFTNILSQKFPDIFESKSFGSVLLHFPNYPDVRSDWTILFDKEGLPVVRQNKGLLAKSKSYSAEEFVGLLNRIKEGKI